MRKESLTNGEESGGEIVLFGVRVKVDPMRKSVSMNNLSEYQLPNTINNEAAPKPLAEDTGYASAGAARGIKERKKGVPWTEEEHKLFLLGLHKIGRGDWRGIARNFVKTRTPTQVASHAQKYFLRKNNLNRRRRRSSLFDITPDSVSDMPMEECNDQEDTAPVSMPAPETPSMASNICVFPATPFPVTFEHLMSKVPVQNPIEAMSFKEGRANDGTSMLVRPISSPIPSSSPNVDLNLNHRFGMESTQLSLGLSLSSGHGQSSSSSTRHSTFQLMSSFSNGESIISVA